MRAYFDWNATTPPHRDVLDAMMNAASTAWANPSSIHGDGRKARSVVEDAREMVGRLTGADARDVVLTSGGTEANNIALRSAFQGAPSTSPPWLLTSRLEHPSVARVAEALEAEGRARVRWIAVRADGVLDLDDLGRALRESEGPIGLVTAQAVNHETGVMQPLREIAKLTREAKVRFHVDAIQAWGKIDLGVARFDTEAAGCAIDDGSVPWDTVSLAAHKFRGPKGIGALVSRLGTRLFPVLLGGTQEKGLRPGTTDPVLAAGLCAAARRAKEGPARYAKLSSLRDELESALLRIGASMPERAPKVVGDPQRRVPHVTTSIWPGWTGAELVAALDLEGVSVSSGSACSAGTIEPSPVLRAMIGDADGARGVRVSLGEETTTDDVRACVEAFRRVVLR